MNNVRQSICDKFAFLEGMVNEETYLEIVNKALEIYSEGLNEGWWQAREEIHSKYYD